MQAFKQIYLFLSAQQYKITDESTGVINEGVSLWYLPDDNLNPTFDDESEKRGEIVRGIKVGKMSLRPDKRDKLQEFPALYEVTLEMVMVAQKPQVRAIDINYVSTVKVIKDAKKPGEN